MMAQATPLVWSPFLTIAAAASAHSPEGAAAHPTNDSMPTGRRPKTLSQTTLTSALFCPRADMLNVAYPGGEQSAKRPIGS